MEQRSIPPNQTLHLTARHHNFLEFNGSPAAAAGELVRLDRYEGNEEKGRGTYLVLGCFCMSCFLR